MTTKDLSSFFKRISKYEKQYKIISSRVNPNLINKSNSVSIDDSDSLSILSEWKDKVNTR